MTRRLVPSPLRIRPGDVTVVPAIEALTSEIKVLIANEIAKYTNKSLSSPLPLDIKATKAIRDLTESLCKLTKESREQARSEDLSNLSNEELLELASKLITNNHNS